MKKYFIFILLFSVISLYADLTNTYGGTGDDAGRSVQQTNDGGYIITGYTDSYGAGNEDVWLIKTDTNGDTTWTKTYGGSSYDRGYSVQQTNDGGYIITGYTWSYGAGYEDVWLIKTDANGDTAWAKTYGGSGYDFGKSVKQTNDGGYIITGYTNSYGAGSAYFWLIKTDVNSDTVWTKIYGGSSSDYGYSVQQTGDGGYIVSGYTESYGAGNEDVWLIKIDPPENFNLISPYNNAFIFTANPQLIWQLTVDNIKNYEVYIDDTLRTTTTDTSWTVDYNLTEDIHNWYVIANDSFALSTLSSETWSFELDTTAPVSPDLLKPIGGIILSDTAISFLWSEVTKIIDLSEYQYLFLYSKRSEIRYILEIDTLISFNNALVDTLVDSFTNHIINEGFYYWHVKAYDLAGNESPFSLIDSFGVDISFPVIESTSVIPDTNTTGPFNIDVKIIDNFGLDSCMLYYQRNSDPDWISDTLSLTGGDWYTGIIPLVQVEDTVKYYIYASDIAQPVNESTDPSGAPVNYYSFIVNAVGIEEVISSIPSIYGFEFNSPANRQIVFRLLIPELSNVQLKIYDLSGRLVSMPINANLSPAYYQISFMPENKGVYFYSIEAENFNDKGKFIIVE